MAKTSFPRYLLLLLLLLVCWFTVTLSSGETPCQKSEHLSSLPDILKNYDLPPGLFPSSAAVTSLKCSPSGTGDRLKVRVTHEPCSVVKHVPENQRFAFFYETRVSALLFKGAVKCLTGVRGCVGVDNDQRLATVQEVSTVLGVGFQLFSFDDGFSPVFLFDDFKEAPECVVTMLECPLFVKNSTTMSQISAA